MKNTLRIVVATALIALFTLFCFYIWPTRYFYDKIETGQSAVYLRIDRFTGEVSRLDLSNNTWVTAKTLADREAELKGRLSLPTPTPENIFYQLLEKYPPPGTKKKNN